jgi:hypothetical protein
MRKRASAAAAVAANTPGRDEPLSGPGVRHAHPEEPAPPVLAVPPSGAVPPLLPLLLVLLAPPVPLPPTPAPLVLLLVLAPLPPTPAPLVLLLLLALLLLLPPTESPSHGATQWFVDCLHAHSLGQVEPQGPGGTAA